MIVRHYDIFEDMLKDTPFAAGSVYFCNDTKNIYYDRPETGERVKMGDIIILDTDAERLSLLAPVPFKIYYVKDANKFYINDGVNWSSIGSSDFVISISGSSTTSLTADAQFESILSVYTNGMTIRAIYNGLNLYLNEYADNAFVFTTTTSVDNKYLLMTKIMINSDNTVTLEQMSGDSDNETTSVVIDDVLYVRSIQHTASIEDGILTIR